MSTVDCSAHMGSMETTDPRIEAIIAHTPFLMLVGTGTIGRILQAAEELGYIPLADTKSEFGVDYRTDGGSVHEVASLEAANSLNDSGSIKGPVVRREKTTYRPRITDWAPVTTPEENRV